MDHPVSKLLALWPDRKAIHADALAADPDLDIIAVYRWEKRASIPPKYWQALIAGAKRRRIKAGANEFVQAHAADVQSVSPSAPSTSREAS